MRIDDTLLVSLISSHDSNYDFGTKITLFLIDQLNTSVM